jgi:uncharacterized protein (DUF2252 family)
MKQGGVMADDARQGGGAPAGAAGPFASSWRRRHLTVDERVARGRTARQEVPRSSHGRWTPAADRPDPVALLEEQAASRVPRFAPVRYGRMLVSPFTFYRGGALIMAADLAATPVSGVTVHSAYKMAGVGSVGTRCYILLLTGRDHNDPLFLQVKEAQPSVLERFLGASTYAHRGERVVAGQRLMQAATDIFLGWQRIRGMDGVTRDSYVRQFQDWKGSADVDTLLVPGATLYARICGATLARAHARWGDRIAIASYLGKGDTFDRAMADFSVAYADQNERDYAAFAAAIDSGRLVAQTGV